MNGQSDLTGRGTYVKGDPYIRDMKNTSYVTLFSPTACVRLTHGHVRSGHVAELTACAWHPRDPQTFITSSLDSTIRCVPGPASHIPRRPLT